MTMMLQFFKRHVFDVFEDNPETVSACMLIMLPGITAPTGAPTSTQSSNEGSHSSLPVKVSSTQNQTTPEQVDDHDFMLASCAWSCINWVMYCWRTRRAWELALNDLQQLKTINTQLSNLGRKMRRYVHADDCLSCDDHTIAATQFGVLRQDYITCRYMSGQRSLA